MNRSIQANIQHTPVSLFKLMSMFKVERSKTPSLGSKVIPCNIKRQSDVIGSRRSFKNEAGNVPKDTIIIC